ncbi:hypothetical protein DUNSADRAFT_14594 [Dunaliella salina]|uniref:Encoded protein n=1 Tax=Dunaliella salina TaxID=3046 RepID=A0ABQ7H2F3_DUNSA|nr:hypothetical protein DUNSADRAFT_14594 [Dunaliella salina]|eukprot:KAF5841036.1 hypothetical protein DUNSADRAFT_14594 [Dunaliella salina]
MHDVRDELQCDQWDARAKAGKHCATAHKTVLQKGTVRATTVLVQRRTLAEKERVEIIHTSHACTAPECCWCLYGSARSAPGGRAPQSTCS